MPKKRELTGEAGQPVVKAPAAAPAIVCHLNDNKILMRIETLERDAWLERSIAQEDGPDAREIFLDVPACDLKPGEYYWDDQRGAFMPLEQMRKRKEELDYAKLDLECRVAELNALEMLCRAADLRFPKVCGLFRTHAQQSLERARSLRRDI